MGELRGLGVAAAILATGLALSGCAARHQLQKLASPDGTFILVVDYITTPLQTHDVVVSLEEKRGIATTVAVFRNIETFSANWLGPEDINICQLGTVQDYKTHVTINAHDGNHDFHFHYDCTSS